MLIKLAAVAAVAASAFAAHAYVLPAPGAGEVRIEVTALKKFTADSGTITGTETAKAWARNAAKGGVATNRVTTWTVTTTKTTTSLVNGALIALAHTPDAATGWGLTALYDAAWFPGLAVFVIGWIIQFVGHIFEGRKPAFVDDVVGLLVGPMFVVGEVLMMAGMLRGMHSLIEAQAGATR